MGPQYVIADKQNPYLELPSPLDAISDSARHYQKPTPGSKQLTPESSTSLLTLKPNPYIGCDFMTGDARGVHQSSNLSAVVELGSILGKYSIKYELLLTRVFVHSGNESVTVW